MKSKQYGLIGYPLSHSFSQPYFTGKFEKENLPFTYDNFPLKSIEKLSDLLKNNPDLVGLNVTIPYKETVIPYLDVLSPAAKAINAVNTIVIEEQLTGYNTDIIGFQKSLEPLLQPHHTRALILGNGGAAKAVKYVLSSLGIGYSTVTRNQEEGTITFQQITAETITKHLLIINCTPLGTAPNVQEYPDIPYKSITEYHLLYDLVYNPTTTLFLTKGKAQGAVIKNGLEMLHLQAEASWEIWKNHN